MKQLSGAAAKPAGPSRSGRRIAVIVERPDGSRSNVPISKPFARLGRDGRAEISIDDPKLLPCHAYLQATGEGVYVAGLADDVSSGWLHPHVPLRIGGFLIHLAYENDEPHLDTTPDLQAKHGAPAPYPRLRVFSEKSPGGFTDFALSRRLTLVGRQLPSTWRIKHPTLSRIHCVMFWDDNQLWLVDLFSSNGTRVGEARFDAGMLSVGQDFQLGTVHCRYIDNSLMARPSDSDIADPRQPDLELRQELTSFQERFAKDSANAAEERQRNVTSIEGLLAEQAGAKETIAQLERRLAEQQRTLDEHRSIMELKEKSATGIAELAGQLRTIREEFRRQRQADEQERQQTRALVEKLRADADGHRVAHDALERRLEDLSQRLSGLAGDLSQSKVELSALKSELTCSVQQHLDTLAASGEDLGRRFKEGMAAVARQLGEQREETQGRQTEWREEVSAIVQQAAQQREMEVSRLERIEQRQDEQLAQQEKWLAGISELSSQTARLRQDCDRLTAVLAEAQATITQIKEALDNEPLRTTVATWENRLNELAGDIERRAEEGAQQFQEVAASVNRRFADFERTIAAELIHVQRQLREEMVCASRDAVRKEPSAASSPPLTQDDAELAGGDLQPSPSDSQTVLTEFAAVGPGGDSAEGSNAPMPLPSASDEVPPPHGALATLPSADPTRRVLPPGDTAAPEWLADDELTQRLVDFKTKREQSFRQRRLIWGLVAGGLVAGIVATAAVVHFWTRNPSSDDTQPAAISDTGR